jgi:hypothetical protein
MVSLPSSLQGTVVASTLFDRALGMFDRAKPAATAKPARPDKPDKPEKPVAKPSQAYHAVSIQPGNPCCQRARALQGQRFLSRDAPRLPLKNCSRETCTCHYQHYDDRRGGPRRAREIGVAMDGWHEAEQRAEQGRGRRKTDRS